MENKKRKLESPGQKETVEKQTYKFQLNENIIIFWNLNQKQMCERSTLLKGLFENCEFGCDQPINLRLDRPEKFCILLKYLETGNIPKELNIYSMVTDYINDIIYLGMEELESYIRTVLSKAMTEKKCEEIDFSEVLLSFDFMERLMRETEEGCSFERCQLLMAWMGKNNIDRRQLETLTKFIQFDGLNFEQINKLAEQFPDSFDYVMKPSILLTIRRDWYCHHCQKLNVENNTFCLYCGRQKQK
eukprot:TRINITY_DN7636_c0_g1_i1.p1 TRINITY_DN7636_c0_g1~~TRINITY_DN7636_c0_g1_i1.p1  ORF type:complete len:245 (+),score=9.94 TRINITY_DN7636_c0_g1_i1:33-767(+)